MQMARAFGDGPKAPLPKGLVSKEEPAPPPKPKVRARKRVTHRDGMGQFVDKKGVPLLTNRIVKYRGRRDYEEVEIKYTPVIVAPAFKKLTSASQYSSSSVMDLIGHYARQYRLDPNLIKAVIQAESNFNPHAVSRCGARGLMQLMPETAAEMGVTDIFDPAQNIAGGTQYLAKMIDLFRNRDLALAAYNAGPNAVINHNYRIPPYEETRGYVKIVSRLYKQYAGGRVTPAYKVASSKPSASALPGEKAWSYMVHFRSGYTQGADNVIDQAPYYYVQYGERTALIRKEHVTKVIGPA